jgi:hypothetical protein
MKILYIPTKVPHDFQRETINWGLRNLSKSSTITVDKSCINERLYTCYNDTLHHFTYYKKWEEFPTEIDGEILDEKLSNKYYDIVIVQDGLFPGIYNEQKMDMLYKIYNKNLFIVDGEDGSDGAFLSLLKRYPNVKYFRRELSFISKYGHNYIFPINFGYPDELIMNESFDKNKDISRIIPGDGNTYIYNEELYYNEYRSSKMAYTFSKGGWDCLRHLEIIFNDCLPLFLDIEHCPHYTLYYYPKFLLSEVLKNLLKINYSNYNYPDISRLGKNEFWKKNILDNNILIGNMDQYLELKHGIFEHCLQRLTCKTIVKNMLEHYE